MLHHFHVELGTLTRYMEVVGQPAVAAIAAHQKQRNECKKCNKDSSGG
jgi:hypothetical protein